MDVQAAAAIATIVPPSAFQGIPGQSGAAAASSSAAAVAPVAAPAVSAPAPSSNSDAGSGSSGNSAIGQTPGLATLPAGPPDGSKKGQADKTLSSGVAQLYNAQEQNVSVSFQIEQNPNEIVTVFTDKQTGKVIVQFPSETLIALAKFFDKLDGSVVNKKA